LQLVVGRALTKRVVEEPSPQGDRRGQRLSPRLGDRRIELHHGCTSASIRNTGTRIGCGSAAYARASLGDGIGVGRPTDPGGDSRTDAIKADKLSGLKWLSPLVDVWESEIVPLLASEEKGVLQAPGVLS
jgi:hypothetical protein